VSHLTIDDAIKQLTELKKTHGGDAPLVMQTGETEDDWDRYAVFSYVKKFWGMKDRIGPHVIIDKANQHAYKI
jgi:hypothetical protein